MKTLVLWGTYLIELVVKEEEAVLQTAYTQWGEHLIDTTAEARQIIDRLVAEGWAQLMEEARLEMTLHFVSVRLMEEAQAALAAVDEIAGVYAAEVSC